MTTLTIDIVDYVNVYVVYMIYALTTSHAKKCMLLQGIAINNAIDYRGSNGQGSGPSAVHSLLLQLAICICASVDTIMTP